MRTLLILALATLPGIARASCSTADIELQGVLTRPDIPPYSRVTGMIKNRCPEPTGVQIEITIKTRDGQVFNVSRPWPASTKNIPGGGEFPFSLLLDAPDMPNKSVSVRIVDVKSW